MADSKKYNGSTWEHSLRKLTTATEAVENPLYSDGTAITSYTIKGNTAQNGTPSNSVGVRTANVMPFASAQTIVDNGVTFVSDGTGQYTVNGTATADASADFDIPEFTIPVSVGAGGQGTFSLFNDNFGGNDGNVIEFYNNTTLIDAWSLHLDNRTSTTYVAMSGKKCNRIRIVVKSGISIDHKSVKPMFTNNSTLPTVYEPYGYKIPISNGQQTIDIYIGDLPLLKSLDGTAFDEISNGTLTRRVDSDGSVLPTPTTTQITTPSIPTIEGANSITVDTAVQPSEVTATYKGWHPVADVHEKSKNLFDEVYPSITTSIKYKSIYVGDGEFTGASDVPVINNKSSIWLLEGQASSGASGNNSITSDSKTVTSIDGYVTIAYRNTESSVDFSQYHVMLNSGSTALPYEPYWT